MISTNEQMLQAECFMVNTLKELLDRSSNWGIADVLRFNYYMDHTSKVTSEFDAYGNEKTFEMYAMMKMAWGTGGSAFDGLNNPHSRFLFDDFCDLLDENGIKKIWHDLKKNHIGYGELIESCDVLISKESDYNIIIPVRNRQDNVVTQLKHMNRFFNHYKKWSVTFIFQESNTRTYDYVKDMNLDYVNLIHVPHDLLESRFEDSMNKSLCYNIASKIVKCKWQVNHDVDLIFLPEFLDHIENKSVGRKKWFQPYRGSRVICLDEKTTETLKNNIDNEDEIEVSCEIPPMNETPYDTGAPGGSLVVRWDDFQEMGGYDPELIFGYAPEDHMFWRKLEGFYDTDGSNLLRKRARCQHPFFSSDVFSHESDVELIHMWHPPSKVCTKYSLFHFFFAHYITNRFTKIDHADWINLSREAYRS
jgi:hypothetical protein